MKVYSFILLIALCYVQCRKIKPQIDKNANLAFINMEGGGVQSQPGSSKALGPAPAPSPAKSAVPAPVQPEPTPVQPAPTPKSVPTVLPPKPVPTAAPKPAPTQITPKAVYTTPGPGSVKQLITYYDSQGKASLIRPYNYSQAVKQG